VVILPAVALVLTWLVLMAADADRGPSRNLLRAIVLAGGWTVVVTEALSLVYGITQAALAAAWLLPSLGLAAWLVAHRRRIREIRLKLADALPATRGEWALTCGVTAILGVTALVAFFAPPQTWDSLNYHMSRVAHWAQAATIRIYATGIEVQNSRPPAAEYGILHLYVLAGGDRLANFVEWSSMVGSLVGVAVLVRGLGGGRTARYLAVVYVVTLPMGISQASSTMNDYVLAFWIVCLAVEIMTLLEAPDRWSTFYVGLAAGLAALTKPMAYFYLLPLLVWLGVGLLRRQGWKQTTRVLAAAGLAAAIINFGFWTRSTIFYGSPVSDVGLEDLHVNQLRDFRALISNVIRNAGLHAGTPSNHVNKALTLAVFGLHDLMGLDVNDPRTTAHGNFEVEYPTTIETKAGNPLQALLALLALGLLCGRAFGDASRLRSLALATVVGFVLFSYLTKWQVFASRYHLPVFILLGAITAVVFERRLSRGWNLAIGFLLLAACLPWLLGIRSRPVISRVLGSPMASVLTASRLDLLFANGDYLRRPYADMTGLIADAQCRTVGLALSGNGAEYPLWALLGAPRPDLRVEWLVSGTPSAQAAPSNFHPCAVICENCPEEWTRRRFAAAL
jgi:hypothetical protein